MAISDIPNEQSLPLPRFYSDSHSPMKDSALRPVSGDTLLGSQASLSDARPVAPAIGSLAEVLSRSELAREVFERARILYRGGLFFEAIDLLEDMLVLLLDLPALFRSFEHEVLLFLGESYYQTGGFETAQRYFQRGLANCEANGDSAGMVWALGGLGNCHLSLGDYAGAIDCHERGVGISAELDGSWFGAWSRRNLATAYFEADWIPEAAEQLETSLSLFRELGDSGNAAWCLNYLGNCYSELAALSPELEQRAYDCYEEAHDIFLELEPKDNLGTATADFNLGVLDEKRHDLSGAISRYGASLAAIMPVEPAASILGPYASLRSLAFGPLSQSVVCGYSWPFDGMLIWPLAELSVNAQLPFAHADVVAAVAVSPDGTRIASCGGDFKLKVWDASSLECLYAVDTKALMVRAAFSPDGRFIATAGFYADDIFLWDQEQRSYALRGHSHGVVCLAFSPDGRFLASGGRDQTLRVWDWKAGELVYTYYQEGNVMAVAFSPDGQYLVSSHGKTIEVWDTTAWMIIRTLHPTIGGDVDCLAFSPDGGVLAIGGSSDIRLWDLTRFEELEFWHESISTSAMRYGHWGTFITSLAFSPDGRFLVASGYKAIWIWDAISGDHVYIYTVPGRQYVETVAFSSDGTRLVSGSGDGWIRVWDMANVPRAKEVRLADEVRAVATSPDGQLIASCSDSGGLELWDARAPARLGGVHYDSPTTVVFSPGGQGLAVGTADHTIHVLASPTLATMHVLDGHPGSIVALSFVSGGQHLISASEDGTIVLWDLKAGGSAQVLDGPCPGGVQAMAVSSDGRVVATVSDSAIRLMNRAQAGSSSILIHPSDRSFTSLAFDPTSELLVSGDRRGELQLWDVANAVLIQHWDGQHDDVTGIAFSPDAQTIASGDADGVLHLWDVERVRNQTTSNWPYPDLAWRLNYQLGSCYRAHGIVSLAIEHWRIAIDQVESLRSGFRVASSKLGFMADKYQPYSAIVIALMELGESHEAIGYAECAKARAFTDMMATAMLTRDDILPAALQTASRMIADTGGLAKSAEEPLPPDADARRSRAGAARTAERSELEYETYLEQLEKEHPELGQSLSVVSDRLLEQFRIVQAKLGTGSLALEYFVTSDETIVWAVSRDGISNTARILTSRSELVSMIRNYHEKLSSSPASTGTAISLAEIRAAGRALYDLLIRPVQELVEAATHLVVVPSDVLFYLPFGTLYDCSGCEEAALLRGQFLAERMPISYAPSLAALYWPLQRGLDMDYNSALVVGANPDPAHPLSYSTEEAQAVAASFPTSHVDLLLGPECTETKVRSLIDQQSYDSIHFSTHGFFDQVLPLRSHIQLLPDGEADGVLHAGEILGLELAGSLVVLSACQTALPPELTQETIGILLGDEIQGLGQALFCAGASSNLLTLWNVNDRSTRFLMGAMYRALQDGSNKAAALRQAQSLLIDDVLYQHPFYWAPFVLYGDWR